MTIGLALIAKNEEKRLPELLKSVEGAFDEVVLADTGSTDRTRDVFLAWGGEEQKRNPAFVYEVRYFHWIHDFSAARRFAHSLLNTDWHVWADCDDVIIGAQNLRGIAAQTPDDVAGIVAEYNYAQHPKTGECICRLKRERIVRRGRSEWVNRVHEAQVLDGPVVQIAPTTAEWVHRKQHTSVDEMHKFDARRNLDILDRWIEDEPDNARTLAYLGTENAAIGEIDKAIPYFEKYLSLNPEWDEERAQVYRKLAMCLLIKQKPDQAIDLAFQALNLLPSWTDSYITLAEAYFTKNQYHKSIEWGLEALRRGQPNTMLIINPLDYTYQPMKVLAGAYAGLKQYDEAVKYGNQAWQLNPLDEGLGSAVTQWRGLAKREHTANTVAMLAQALIAHDEQLKALYLLEHCVPWFAEDHAGVVSLRSQLRERLEWIADPHSLLDHYAEGGSKPEDFLPDDKIDEVASNLPRTAFLYRGIHEQMVEMNHDGLIQEAIEKQLPGMAALVGPS